MKKCIKNQLPLTIHFLFILVTVSPALAGFSCPDIGYKFEGGSRDGQTCFYENNITITSSIGSEPEDCFSNMNRGYIWEDRDPFEIDTQGEVVWLYSHSHAASVGVHLNTKEFKKSRRAFWIEKAQKQLKVLENKAFDCKSPEMIQKFSKGFAPVSCPETKFERDLTKTPPGLKDDLSGLSNTLPGFLNKPSSITCEYKYGTSINVVWNSKATNQGECSDQPNIEPVTVSINDNAFKSIGLTSASKLSDVYIYLTDREMEPENRNYWITIGKEVLKEAEAISLNCPGSTSAPALTQPKENVSQKQALQKNPTTTGSSKDKTQGWDSWDAPSPKAKIPE